MDEQWRDITGYEDYYQVSSLGRVMSVERYVQQRDGMKRPYRIPPKILKPKLAANGYLRVNLSVQGKAQAHSIHRLVAEAFLPNPDRLPTVNHKDEVKTNNVVCLNPDGSIDHGRTNLEWCTQEYNNTYGTRPQRVQASQKHRRPVVMLDADGTAVMTFPTTKAAARYIVAQYPERQIDIRIADNNIRAVCHHRQNRHMAYGHRWEFSK